jgi:hypothetical protein
MLVICTKVVITYIYSPKTMYISGIFHVLFIYRIFYIILQVYKK